jgi:outer membrane receptor protein involved in Fe transport
MRTNFERAGDQSVYGLEWDARFAATENLALLANYTFQQNNWRSSIPFHQTDLISPPKHKFMVGMRYSPTDDLHLSSHLYWVDAVRAPNPINPFAPRRLASYFRLDLFGEYEFWDDRAAVSVGVRNLIDSHHPEGGTQFLNDAEVPRMIYAQLRLSLD